MKSLLLALSSALLFGCGPRTDKSPSPPPNTPTPIAKSTHTESEAPPGKTYEGPFGLAMGISSDELTGKLGFTIPDGTEDVYAGKPPKPGDGFSEYYVLASAKAGLCKIIGNINVPVVNGTGDQLKVEADKLAELIELKYGKPTRKFDDSLQDVYVRNPQFWMMGLTENSVMYSYSWRQNKTAAQLPYDLESIEIDVAAIDINSGRATLRYTFKNFDACRAEFRAKKAANL